MYEFFFSLSKARENGIHNREYNFWERRKPKCLLSSRVLSVGNNELFLVYMILMVGMFLSVLILMVEVVWYKVENAKQPMPY